MSVHEGSLKRKKSKSKSTPSKKRGIPRKPSRAMLKFSMTRYKIYDPASNEKAPLPRDQKSHHSFDRYDDFRLYMLPSIKNACEIHCEIPREGIRLDDMHVATVLGSGLYGKRTLNRFWKAEFDAAHGMTRTTRVPLGHAAKEWKNVGDVDIDGNVLQEGEQGWYYLWHRGIHLLGGQECLDAELYLQRPSDATERCQGTRTTWKSGYRAAVQLPPGDRSDTTFAAMNLPDFAFLPKATAENSTGDMDAPSHGGESSKGEQGLQPVTENPDAKDSV